MLNFKFSLLTILCPNGVALFSVKYSMRKKPWSLFSIFYASKKLEICIFGIYFSKVIHE